MASGSEIVGATGAVANIIPGLIGRGKSQYQAQDISHSGMYDPFAYQFGNYGAENYAQGREQQAQAIDRRSAPQANYMQADLDRQRALQARASQATVMNQLMARAAGQTPSIAGMQAAQDMQRAQAAQQAQAASARGPAALALAQQNAANNTANVQGRISNTSQINAANERMQAEQAAFGAASGMRGQDYQSQGQAAQQAQYQAGLQMANRQTNDARALSTQQMGHQALGQEQQGRVQQQAIAAQSHANAQQQNAETERQNAGSKGIIDTAVDWFTSDMRAKEPLMMSDFSAKLQLAPEPGQAPTGSGLWGGALQRTPLPSLVGGGGLTTSTWGGGGTNPMSGPGAATFDKLNSNIDDVGTSMDVTGSLQRHSNFATQYQSDPTSGMTGGAFGSADMMLSDDRTKLKAAFEEGAKYADAAHAGVQIKPPTYAVSEQSKPEQPKAPSTIEVKSNDPTHPSVMMPAQPGGRVPTYKEAVQYMAAQQKKMAPPPVPPMVTSDFRAKEGLTRDADGNPAAGDPNAPQFRFVPGQGWQMFNAPQYVEGRGWVDERPSPQRPDLDAAMKREADPGEPGDYNDDAYWRAKVEKNDRHLEQQAEWAKADEPMADKPDAEGRPQRQAPGTADFQKTEPKPTEDGAPKPWWMAMQGAANGLNEAQFGKGVRSDRRAKNVIDLDEVDADEGTDRSQMRDGPSDHRTYNMEKSFHRDTKADQARVKKGVEDRAGRDADEMMAGYSASLGKGNAVQERAAASMRPSESPVAQANRTMHGEPYRYKPEFTPPEQKPGEPNFGFMAQNLEKSPITATAVKEDPNGLKRVDALKLLRILGASVADLQEQQDQTRLALSKGGRK